MLVLAAASLLLAACSGSSSPAAAPSDVNVVPGDSQVVVSFDQQSNLVYWIFLAQAASITRSDYNTFPGARIFFPAYSPQVVTGLSNDTQYAFLMNATAGGAAGPSSASIAATPRPAADTFVDDGPASAANLTGVAYGALAAPRISTLVAVGSGGTVLNAQLRPGGTLLAANGSVPWTVPTAGQAANADLNAVVFSTSLAKYCAVGASGTEITSPDGVIWTPATTAGTSADLYGVTAFGSTLVAVGAGGVIVTSTDGLTWTPRSSPTANDLLGVEYTGGVLIAVGRVGTLLTSADAAIWTQVAVPTAADLHDVVYGLPHPATTITASPAWIAVGSGGTILRNTTGASAAAWIQQVQAISNSALNSVTIGSRFSAVGAGGTTLYSDDGVVWNAASDPSQSNLNAVRYVGGVYIAVGASGASVTSQ